MERTTKRFAKRLETGDDLLKNVRVQNLEGVLVPPGKGKLRPAEGEEWKEFTKEAVFSPRIRMLLGALQERKVFFDDVLIWVGQVPEKSMSRVSPYVLIEIPRLQGR